MSPHRSPLAAGAVAVAVAAALAACSGGGGGGTNPVVTGPVPTSTPTTGATPTPVATATPTTSTQQVVTMALPQSVMGSRVEPTIGTIGGYTQQSFSQTLGFAPGTQIMVRNGQTGVPHTLGVVSTTGFDAGGALTTNATGGSTIAAGFNTGSVAPSALVGPFTLATGTYYLGCAFHYTSDTMRTVLAVAAGATPGPQATPPSPTQTPPPGGIGY